MAQRKTQKKEEEEKEINGPEMSKEVSAPVPATHRTVVTGFCLPSFFFQAGRWVGNGLCFAGFRPFSISPQRSLRVG